MGADSKDSLVIDEIMSSDILNPEIFILRGEYVFSGADPEMPLYQMSGSVTSVPQKGTSISIERSGNDMATEKAESNPTEKNEHLYYLAHPPSPLYQADPPAYYLTSVSSGTLGNISLEISKPRLQKPEFRILLSPGRNWTDNPLFDDNPQILFDVKRKWIGGQYTWTDTNGSQVAYEDGKGDQNRLVITASMKRGVRDALVATWCLRLWHDTAESRHAKKDAMERLTPADSAGGYNLTWGIKIGALGSLGGAGA
ncbi:hypothetical protein M426DRAFT_315869 [Hypoxylon sp. CI-4A]|nr:hypothetical protein M426DRAFT_315869 [Hypoxylon sp. CI-4A]